MSNFFLTRDDGRGAGPVWGDGHRHGGGGDGNDGTCKDEERERERQEEQRSRFWTDHFSFSFLLGRYVYLEVGSVFIFSIFCAWGGHVGCCD